jgi:7-keto-8-aminopelargonate synthetase-like enzyme
MILETISEAPGRTIVVDGREYLFFSGYSYLGMSHVPAFIELLKEGLDRYGALYPSSRVSNTPLSLYGHLEHYLTQLTGRGATVTFSSGFLACTAAGRLVAGLGEVLVAPETHPATGMTGNTLGATSYDDWCNKVLAYTTNAAATDFVLVMDSVAPLEGAVRDFVFLQELPRHKRFTVLIDDSHGIGWMGAHGEGISGALMHLPHVDYVLAYSLSKALHVQGGAVGCSRAMAERLQRSPLYTGSTPMAPAYAHALLSGGPLYEVQRARLAHHWNFLIRCKPPGLVSTAIPVFLCPGEGIAARLEKKGILISSFAYPDPSGEVINRVVMSALHQEADIVRLCDALAQND